MSVTLWDLLVGLALPPCGSFGVADMACTFVAGARGSQEPGGDVPGASLIGPCGFLMSQCYLGLPRHPYWAPWLLEVEHVPGICNEVK